MRSTDVPTRHASILAASALIKKWTGFETTSTAPRRIGEFLAARAQHLGFANPEAYLRFLQRQSPRDTEPQRLINLVTNGLTAFWRDAEQLEAVAGAIRRLGLRRKGPLQIWCAGCSTGEEVYTLAMIAREAKLEAQILGSDVNTEVLDLAMAGRFGAWSLRRLNPARRLRYFNPLSSNLWEVVPELREGVHFLRHNLLRPTPASLAPGRPWDLILCRNVLIYLSEPSRNKVLKMFGDSLAADGYLFLGASEQVDHADLQLHSTRIGVSFAYHRADDPPSVEFPLDLDDDYDDLPEPQPAPPAAPQPSLDEISRPSQETPSFGIKQRVSQHTPGQLPSIEFPLSLGDPGSELDPPASIHHELGYETTDIFSSEDVEALIQEGTASMRRGDDDQALGCFEAAACYDPFIPETYCLIGLIFQNIDAPHRALEAFRKALFLTPSHWLAAFEAAKLYEYIGDYTRAKRHYRQTLSGLDERNDVVDLSLLPLGNERADATRATLRKEALHGLDRIASAL